MKDADFLHPAIAQALAPVRPPLRACQHCGSLYCGPIRCRFEDTEALSRDEDRYYREREEARAEKHEEQRFRNRPEDYR